jgi:hypothetical protein
MESLFVDIYLGVLATLFMCAVGLAILKDIMDGLF